MRKIAALVALLFPLVIYVLTLAREITFTDSGELAAAAATLGIAHPPGYPLFTLIGRLFSLLPVSTVAFGVGLVSACSAALTSLFIYLVGSALLRWLLPEPATGRRAVARARGGILLETALALSPLAGALLFAFSRTPWSQAVVVEVYALQALLVTAFLWAALSALGPARDATRSWPLLGLAIGLAVTNHLTGVLLIPVLALTLIIGWLARPPVLQPARPQLWTILGAALLPLLLYLYLPLRSRMSPPVNWNFPETLHRFLVHVTARQFHGMFGSKGIRSEELARFLTEQLPGEATWILVALAAVGLTVLLWKWRSRGGIVTLAAAAVLVIYNMGYPIHDINLYYVPVLAIVALWAAVGAGIVVWLASRLHPALPLLAAAVFCLSSLLPLTAHWRDNDQSDFKLIARHLRDSLKYLEPNAVLFTGRWDTVSSPALYYQIVEGYRPDVVVLDLGRLSSPVLGRELSATAPDLAAACRAEIAAVAEIGRLAESGRSYDIAEGRNRFRTLRRKLVVETVARRPTYVTGDLFRQPMLAGFNLIAEGLVARVTREDTLRPFPLPEFEGPGIRQAAVRNARERDLFVEYSRMLDNRARVLARHGRMDEAARFEEKARELAR